MFFFLHAVLFVEDTGVYPNGVGKAVSHIFKSGGVDRSVILTDLLRLDRQIVA